jgi:hypothetical protein
MMQYSRSGMYSEFKKNTKRGAVKKNNSVDWINILLFVVLLVVVVVFIAT